MKKVYGNYLTAAEARKAVDKLLDEGFTRDEIKVVAKKDLSGELSYMQDDLQIDDRSIWEKIKDAFTFDEYHEDYWNRDLMDSEKAALQGYKTNLEAGGVVVLVEDRT